MPSEEQCGLGLSCSVCRMGLRPDSSHTSRPGRRTTPANAAGRRRGLPRALPPMPGTLSLTLPPACSSGTGVECRPELTLLLAWDCSAPALPGKLVPRAFQSHEDILTSCGPQAAAGSGSGSRWGPRWAPPGRACARAPSSSPSAPVIVFLVDPLGKAHRPQQQAAQRIVSRGVCGQAPGAGPKA